MADFHVIHAYLCGHFDSTPVPSATGPQHVFVNSGCSDYLCTHTSTSWFESQGTPPDPKDMSLLAKYSRQLTTLQNTASKYASGLAGADPCKAQCVAEIGFPNLLDLVFADNPQSHLEVAFHIGTIKALLQYARQFAKIGKRRPFFDFCMAELAYFVGEADAADVLILKALRASDMLTRDSLAIADFCQWPGARGYHEPGFGKKELEMLRSAGDAGAEVLAQPFGHGTLHVANLLIRTLVQQSAAPMTPPPALPCLIAATTAKALPAPPALSTDFAMWVAEQEKAFVSELKAATAKKVKKIVRRCRARKLGRVGTRMDRVSKSYLPGLVRCA